MGDREPPLEEKDFIQDRLNRSPTPFWIWLIVFLSFIAIVWIAEQGFYSLVGNDDVTEEAVESTAQ